jgi:hypothetical protein
VARDRDEALAVAHEMAADFPKTTKETRCAEPKNGTRSLGHREPLKILE